jgi:hypothetical protein
LRCWWFLRSSNPARLVYIEQLLRGGFVAAPMIVW